MAIVVLGYLFENMEDISDNMNKLCNGHLTAI